MQPATLFDWEQFMQQTVQHYAAMARNSGAIDYARARVMELERDPCGLFKGLGAMVRAALKT